MSGAYFICRMVTKWSRISSDRVTEDVINPPSGGFFETRHDVGIRVDGQGVLSLKAMAVSLRWYQRHL